ncbi:MAG TPA: phage tail length tape measure family protein [Dongiaceae bacterium]|nr:phage tail length tape measure family protein [Dongiaceae bacterium]
MADTYQKIYQVVIDASKARTGGAELVNAINQIIQAGGQAQTATASLSRLSDQVDAIARRVTPGLRDSQAYAASLARIGQLAEASGKPLSDYADLIDLVTLKYDASARAAKVFQDANSAAIASLSQVNLAQLAEQQANQYQSLLNDRIQLAGSNRVSQTSGSTEAPFAAVPTANNTALAALLKQQEEEEQQQAAAQARLQAFTAKYEPLTAATQRYTAAVAELKAMRSADEISEERYTAALKIEQTALDAVTAAQARAAKGGGSLFGLNNIGRMELQASAINFVQGISAGISPLRMLQTEAPQVFGAFIQGGLKVSASMIGMGAAITGAALVVGGIGYAFEAGSKQANAFNQAMRLTADSSGMTSTRLEQIIASAQKFSDIGALSARSVATEMTASGKLSADVIERLTGLTEDYARATGQTAEKAGTELTKLFSDPKQGMQQLDDQYNLLDQQQRRYIEQLIAQGDRTGAQIALSDALAGRIHNVADNVGYLGQVLKEGGRLWQDFWNAADNIGRPETTGQKLDDLDAKIKKLQADRDAQSHALLGQFLPFSGQNRLQDLINQRSIVQAQQAAEEQKAQSDAAAAQFKTLTKNVGDAAEKYDTFTTKQKALTLEVSNYANALRQLYAVAPHAGPQGAASSARDQAILDAQTAQRFAAAELAAMRTPQDEAIARSNIDKQVAAAGPIARAALQARLTAEDAARHNVQILAQPNAEDLIKQQGSLAAENAIRQQTTAVRDQNAQLDLNARLTLATGEAWMKSATEGAMAAARQQAAVEALTQPINVGARTLQILNQQVNEAVTAGAQQVRSLDDQVAAQQRLAAAAKDGPLAEHQAEVTNQIAAATKDLNDKLQLAFATKNTKAAADLQAEIAGIAQRTRDADAAAKEYANNHWLTNAVTDQGYQKQLLQVQLANVGANDNQQQRALAIAQAQIDLVKQHIDLQSEQAKNYVQGAADLADYNAELTRQKAIASELPNAFDQAFDRIGQAVTQFAVQGGNAFQSLQNVGNAVLSELFQEALKLSVVNPLKNWMNGDNALPTWDAVMNRVTQGSGSGPSGMTASQGRIGSVSGAGDSGGWLSGIGSWIGSFFADGGVMTSRGRLPLRAYSTGGVTSTPQLAMFGEGSTPEAYVPVPSGRIPVEIRNFQPAQAANSNSERQLVVHFNFQTAAAVDAFNRSPSQHAYKAARALQSSLARNG